MKTSYSLLIFVLVLVLIGSVNATDGLVYIGDYNVVYSYHDVEEGDKFTLTVTLTNTGSVKEDVMFELKDTRPFDVGSENDWDVGLMNSDESVSKSFRVEVDSDTPEGTYSIEFTLDDSDDDFEDEFEIEVNSDKAELVVSNIASTPLIIGPNEEDVKMEVTIENIGGGDANFVRGKLLLPQGIVSSSSYSDSYDLGMIKSGENKVATFFVDTDSGLVSGIKKANIVLEYKNNVDNLKVTLPIDIPVKGRPIFEVSGSRTIPEKLVLGGNGELRIEVTNTGEEIGEETSVRVFENTDQPFVFDEKTNFIGDVLPGKTGTAVFNVNVDNAGVANNYLLKVQVRTVNRGNVVVDDYTVLVKVIEPVKGISSSMLFIALLVLLIILIIVLVIVVRRQNRISWEKAVEEF